MNNMAEPKPMVHWRIIERHLLENCNIDRGNISAIVSIV